MKYLWSCVAALAVVCGACANAAEPYEEFIAGLRARGYFDTALQYLDDLETSSRTPEEIRTILPFERGVTLMEYSEQQRSPETRKNMLDQAQAQFETFVSASPNHPYAGEANSKQANIFLGRARVNVWSSNSPANTEKREELRAEARQLIGRARAIFEKARDQFEAAYSKFPTFVPPEDKENYEARAEVEIQYILAQLSLAQCTYEEGQTYDRGTDERNKLLVDASKAFDEIHSKYRSMVSGLYARMWQGKCFEEQGDLAKALGIYNELLTHEGSSSVMQRLQDQVRQFRLICLNDESKKDHLLVVQEAGTWVQLSKARWRTQVGLGIRWELARAYEALAADRTLSDADRDRLLQQGLDEAKFINRYPGPYRDVSTFMIRRLKLAMGKEESDPKDFGTAYELGRNLIKEIKPKKDKANAPGATDADRTDYKHHLAETSRMLSLAMTLVDETTPSTELNHARYLLAYTRLLQGFPYDAAIMAEFVARNFIKDNPDTALDAAHLALASYVNAYSAIPERESTEVELRHMEKVANLITGTWPDSGRANEARMTLGRVYARANRPKDAGDAYSQVPRTADVFSDAQLAAGQAYWMAYLEMSTADGAANADNTDVEQLRTQAKKFLEVGIKAAEGEVPADQPAPESLMAARVSLAQVLITQQKYQEAIEQLTGGKHPVVDAVKIDEGKARPPKGVKSKEFARLVYQLMLRCYVGTQQIDEALDTMNLLESVGSGAGDTTVYVQLGKELEKELKRLKSLGEMEQLATVRKSFETFLNELFKRKDGQTYGSLIWIAETYYGLGLGSDDDLAAARNYFAKAAQTYESILDQAATKGDDFAPADRLTGVKLRLVTCKRSEEDFESAFELISAVLKERPKALDAQIEAARVLQDWGASGGGLNGDRLLEAIVGRAPAWGWADLAMKLQHAVDSGQAPADYEDKHLDARYNAAICRRLMGEPSAAKQEIEVFATVAGESMSDEWWSKFEELHEQVQLDMGVAVEPLERPVSKPTQPLAAVGTLAGNAANGSAEKDANKTSAGSNTGKKSEADEGGSSMIWVVLSLLVAVGVAGGAIYAMAKPTKKRRTYGAAPDTLPPTAAASAASPQRPARKRAAGGKRPDGTRRGDGSQRPDGAGGRKTPEGGSGRPKRPRPKRPPQE